MTYSPGIDLGTTYTAALHRGGRAEVVTLGYRMTSIPTVVVLTEDGTFLVGDPAERRPRPARSAGREFKRRVGDPTPLLLGGTPVSVDRLLAEVPASCTAPWRRPRAAPGGHGRRPIRPTGVRSSATC